MLQYTDIHCEIQYMNNATRYNTIYAMSTQYNIIYYEFVVISMLLLLL